MTIAEQVLSTGKTEGSFDDFPSHTVIEGTSKEANGDRVDTVTFDDGSKIPIVVTSYRVIGGSEAAATKVIPQVQEFYVDEVGPSYGVQCRASAKCRLPPMYVKFGAG